MALVEVQLNADHVAELVLNRPEKLNALNTAMLEEFSAAVEQIGHDADIRCVILRGEGSAFSVGYDVASAATQEAPVTQLGAYDDWSRLRRNLERWLAIWDLEKPVIAAIQGYCVGGASMLSVCCDITLVATDAKVAWPSVPLGGGLLSPVSLWLVGMKHARELSYVVGSSMSGTEAADLGWANRAVPPEQLLDSARELASRIARTPASLLRLKKLALNRVMETQGFRTAFLFGAEWDAIAHTVTEHHEMREKIAEMGLREAIQWFQDGGELGASEPG